MKNKSQPTAEPEIANLFTTKIYTNVTLFGSPDQEFSRRITSVLAKWVPRLGLQDWDFDIHVLHSEDMPCSTTTAFVQTFWYCRKAKLGILHPEDYARRAPREDELESDIVHELNHIVVAQLERDGLSFNTADDKDRLERVVECITKAMIRTDRDGNRRAKL